MQNNLPFNKPKSGRIVKNIISGQRGRTYNDITEINGKIAVYYEIDNELNFSNKATLVIKEQLQTIGFID